MAKGGFRPGAGRKKTDPKKLFKTRQLQLSDIHMDIIRANGVGFGDSAKLRDILERIKPIKEVL